MITFKKILISFPLLLLFSSFNLNASTYRVAFVPKGITQIFWKEIARGAEETARKLDINMVWRGPINEAGISAQSKIMSYYVKAKFDGIILAPDSQTAVNGVISTAVKNGIKVFIVDSPLESNHEFPYIGTNNEKAGSLAALQAVRDFPKVKKVLLLRYSKNHGSTNDREKGFLTTLKKSLPKVEINDSIYTGMTVDEAKKSIINYFHNHPRDIDLIFTPNESGTEGVLLGLRELNLSRKGIKLYGFDFNSKINVALLNGEINAVVLQDPYLMGQKSIEFMFAALTKKAYPMNFETPAMIVTAKNLDDKNIKSKISPFLHK